MNRTQRNGKMIGEHARRGDTTSTECYFCKGRVVQERVKVDFRWGRKLKVIETFQLRVSAVRGEIFSFQRLQKHGETCSVPRKASCPPNGRCCAFQNGSLIRFYLLVADYKQIPVHLISLLARASTSGGIVRPICFAVLRLITSSNFVGCSTGRSAGLAPFRILSTKYATRR